MASVLHRAGALELVLRARRRVGFQVLTVLTYHHVIDEEPGYVFDEGVADASPAQFRRQMQLLKRSCTPIGLDEVIAACGGSPLPPNPVLITFDDGYRSNLSSAAPILRDLGMTGVFFVATDYVDQRRLYWWEALVYLSKQARRRRVTLTYPTPRVVDLDVPGTQGALTRVVKGTHGLDVDRFVGEFAAATETPWTRAIERELCDQLIMTWDDVRAMRDLGMEIGSHTASHRVLQTVPDEQLAHELTGSRAVLERELRQSVRAIAYPVGNSIAGEARLRAAVTAAGYRVGFSNASGVNLLTGMPRLDRFDVSRVATDRALSDAMFLAQVAVPPLAYSA